MTAPMTWSTARIRSVAINRSAIMPTKNGEIIAPTAVVPNASPICSPEKCSVSPSHVPIVTYHAPHTKYWRNINVDSFRRTVLDIWVPLRPPGLNGWLRQDDARQEIDRRLQSLVDRRERVLVLDAHDV